MEKNRRISTFFIHSVTSAEATANEVLLQITDGPLVTETFNFKGQIRRAGVEIPNFNWSYATATGILTVADAGAADLTTGDLITISGAFARLSN